MALQDYIDEKGKVLSSGNDFLDSIRATEKSVFSKILEILNKLSQSAGKLKKEDVNNRFLSNLTATVLKAVRTSTLPKKVNTYVANFDKIDKLNDDIYFDLAGKRFTKKVLSEIGAYKKIAIDSVIDGLLGEKELSTNYVGQIRSILTNGIATQSTVKDVETALRTYIKGSGNGGALLRYSRQISRDAIQQYDGLVNEIARNEYGLDGFRYIGSVKGNTRDNCKHLLGITSKLKRFEVRKGMYRVSDLPEIIKALPQGKNTGWNPATNASNFAIYRGGYNCSHQVVFLPLPDED